MGSTQVNQLEQRVALMAINLHAAEAQIANLKYRLEQIEEALQLKADAAKAHDLPLTSPKHANRKS